MHDHKKEISFLKRCGLCVICIAITCSALAQCAITWDEVTGIKKNNKTTPAEKLNNLYRLKEKAEHCNTTPDSVYARLLDFIAAFEYQENSNYKKCIAYALQSLHINKAGGKSSSAYYAMLSYFNVGYYYYAGLNMLDKALPYLDTASKLASHFALADDVVLDSKLIKAFILQRKGDFQKSVDESMVGAKYSLQKKDFIHHVQFLVLKAQSLFCQNQFQQSLLDLQAALPIINLLNDQYNLASALKMMALIYAKTNQLTASDSCFKKCIQTRKSNGNIQQIAADYRDLGILYEGLHEYKEAERNYFKAIEYARQNMDSLILATIYINLEQNSFKQSRYKEAETYCVNALKYLKLNKGTNILSAINPEQLKLTDDRELVFVITGNKTELLLYLFKSTNDKKYLTACLQTALLTDSVITDMRHQQAAEQSKLYWRDFTRGFFTNAMEACFLANDAALAFFFMEKSNAVLLNDKLNEIGASASLPATEAAREESLRMNVVEQQRKLSRFTESSEEYKKLQDHVMQARNDLELFIKALENKYPLYYQYKYADEVPSLKTLQSYLLKSNQHFIHYFLSDTATYILGITNGETKFIKLSKTQFASTKLLDFLRLSSDKQALNNEYVTYSALSYGIFKILFQPLNIPKGRVIICADNFLVPFEALSSDPDGRHFLVYDYAFSYVYSARFVLNKFNDYTAKGDFLGIAPVSFAPYLKVPDLKQSENAINNSAAFYSSVKILANDNANRKNFLRQLPNYTIVNIFSHASADSSDVEPYLCMSDSIINLSQLQLINNPATKLVVLSACETNAGRHATGEGIYSLARGFALVGIPAVSATLWKADETSVYAITELFNRNLSEGMNKDEALQKAKLSFLKNNSNEKQLPYYWANMILVGNTHPLNLSASKPFWWWAGCIGFILMIIILFTVRNKKTLIK